MAVAAAAIPYITGTIAPAIGKALIAYAASEAISYTAQEGIPRLLYEARKRKPKNKVLRKVERAYYSRPGMHVNRFTQMMANQAVTASLKAKKKKSASPGVDKPPKFKRRRTKSDPIF